MGTCFSRDLQGEEYIRNVLNEINISLINYEYLYDWISKNLEKMTLEQAKLEVKNNLSNEASNLNHEDYIEEVLNSIKNDDKEVIPYKKFINYMDEYLVDKDNKYYNLQKLIVKKIYFKHYEYNAFHLNLTLLSFLKDSNNDKISIFFQICTSIKKFFTFEDFKLFLFSYLFNNLYYITYIVYKDAEQKSQLSYSLEGILLETFTDIHIVNYRDSIIEKFSMEKFGLSKDTQKEYFMSLEDFQKILKHKEHLFNFVALRDDFLQNIK